MGLAGAVVGVGALGAIGSVAGASSASDASNAATNAQINASNQSNQIQLSEFNQIQKNLQPYMTAGGNALNAYQQSLGLAPGGTGGINATQFQGSPGYQFQLQQGMNAVQNSAAARGGVVGGNTLKALQTYGQGTANQDYYNYLAQLSGLTGVGQNAAAGVNSAATNYANAASSNAQAAGNASAANAVNQGQITNNLIGGLTSNLFGSIF